ncbi:MAG: ABC transporter permease [Polyangiaceae bacterium]
MSQAVPAPAQPSSRTRRSAGGVAEAIAIPGAAIATSLVLYGVFVAAAGAPPFQVYYQIYRGAFGTWFSLQNTMQRAAPLMLCALYVALPAHLGLIVIGGEGSLVLGGLTAVIVAHVCASSPPLLALATMALAGALAGGLWAALAGYLRVARGVNETISTLLLNYIAIAVFSHLVEGPLRDPASLNKPSTFPIGGGELLGDIPGMDVHWGLVYGIVCCVVAYLLVYRTVFGLAARIVGGNARAALLGGLRVTRWVVAVCGVAGGCAGLAGMIEVAAVHGAANSALIAGYGYTGFLVAFVAGHNPLAIIPVSLLLGGIDASGGLLQRSFGLPDASVKVLQGLLFVVILASESLYGQHLLGRLSLRTSHVLCRKVEREEGAA